MGRRQEFFLGGGGNARCGAATGCCKAVLNNMSCPRILVNTLALGRV